MEHHRFGEAAKALERCRAAPLPPPHALLHLGRHLARTGDLRRARLALRLFSDLYRSHGDRPQALADLARVLRALGETEEAAAVADEARRLPRRAEAAPALG
jgi:uncharacterized protein HemY